MRRSRSRKQRPLFLVFPAIQFDSIPFQPLTFHFLSLMKVLVLGSGGREHALVWKLRQSPRISQLYCAPGNGGIADDAECLPLISKAWTRWSHWQTSSVPTSPWSGRSCRSRWESWTNSIAAAGRSSGRRAAAAQLESSKSFAKEFLQRHHIPTAHYAICDSMEQVRAALGHFHTPVVVKADGLAAGKGVVIAKTKEEAASVAAEMLSGKMLGEAGARVVLEECLRARNFRSWC